MDNSYKTLLEKQQYSFLGEHSASKICRWTKKSLVDQGNCYKQKFYGIKSHLCAQISVSVNFCDNDCIYCWRERNNSRIKIVDKPNDILDNIPLAQKKLLSGFGGNKNINKKKFLEAKNPKHIAISLTGESLYYPKINELIKKIKKRNLTAFVVTNGQLPEILEKIESPTQLYISLNAYNQKLYNKIHNPSRKDAYERFLQSLKILKKLKKKTRTALRLTLIKNINMKYPEKYIDLIKIAEPDFIEIKAYMFVGASKNKLKIENMPYHHEVLSFSKEIEKESDYNIIDEQESSRVILLSKQDKSKIINL